MRKKEPPARFCSRPTVVIPDVFRQVNKKRLQTGAEFPVTNKLNLFAITTTFFSFFMSRSPFLSLFAQAIHPVHG